MKTREETSAKDAVRLGADVTPRRPFLLEFLHASSKKSVNGNSDRAPGNAVKLRMRSRPNGADEDMKAVGPA